MHVVLRSLLKIFEYAAKQACKQLQCNKAKLPEPEQHRCGKNVDAAEKCDTNVGMQ